ncbi:mucin-4-like isoform X2 [Diachasmimorpha longicaudata]|uniref:mucin-4-like isoform X2 n=1 Tax=Diachasmimorpha longicaudata TaxID=58733 RepID=UPI0030B88CFF
MQQPQTRPLLGDSVSSTTSPTARRNNPVAVLTHQQLQQLQQLQAQSPSGQPLTFALQQSPSNNGQDQTPVGSTTGIGNNHIVYLNQLSQLNQSTITPTGTGMGLPPAAPTFGVGLNMGLPLSLLNTSLTSLTSNVITTSNPLLNLGIPSLNSALTTVNPTTLNTLNTLNALNSNLSSNSITTNGLTGIGQDMNTALNRLNQSTINNSLTQSQFSTISTSDNISNISNLTSLTNLNNQTASNLTPQSHGITTSVNQAFNRTSLNVLATGIPTTLNCSTGFPFQTIQSIQSIAPHIVNTSISQNNPTPILSTSQMTNPSQINHSTASTTQSLSFSGTMSQCNLSTSPAVVSIPSIQTDSISPVNTSAGYGHSQTLSRHLQNSTPQGNTVVKCIQNVNSPGSPFSIPMKSPASNIAPPTPSPSPNRILLRSPASNSMQSNRNSPSPVSMANTSTSGTGTPTTVQQNFTVQLQSPMQSPMSVGPIQSPAPSPYPPAKSPHLQGVGGQMTGGMTGNLNNRSPAPGGSPGPSPVRPNTPILQQGMQVLQIIGTPQYQQASSQLVTRAALFGNQQIQIAQTKAAKQPPQILPKPPNSQGVATPPKQRVATSITNQVTQQAQPQLVLAGHHQNQTATMIPTAQGLLLNQLTQQQLVRVVTAQGMQLQGITPTFFAVPNGFPPPAPPVMRHTPSSPAPGNPANNNQIVIQNAMVQSSQPHLNTQPPTVSPNHLNPPQPPVIDQNLLPPPKKKAKKKPKAKKRDEEPPKLDLASIMKISGIGDEDDMFDTDVMTEPEPHPPPLQHMEPPQLPPMTVQHLDHNPPPQNQPQPQNLPITCPNQDHNNQPVAHLQMPVHSTISGHLRLAVGEDGRVILHHTPEPNQPEIDQATAQALIRSLTQGGGQNSQIISQLLGHAQNLQQNQQNQRGKPGLKQQQHLSGNQPSNQLSVSPPGIHTPGMQVCPKQTFQQQQPQQQQPQQHQPQQHQPQQQNNLNIPGQRTIGSSPGLPTNIPQKNLQQPQPGIQISIGTDKSKNDHKIKSHTCKKVFMQNQTVQRQSQKSSNQSSNVKQTGSVRNNRAVQQQITKSPTLPQSRPHQLDQHNEQINQQHIHQISTQTVQSLNVHRCLEQNVHKIAVSGLQQNSMNILGANTDSLTHNLDQNMVQGFVDTPSPINHHQDDTQSSNLNLHHQKIPQNKQQNVIFSSDYPTPINNTVINTSAGQTTKQQVQNPELLNSAATNILNNAPKITPEILNALSNLNPNDQLLIANANGQMQVISQQLLQQLLTGQLNAQRPLNQNQNQNQTQKIVIGETDGSTPQNLPGVQINTPTSQIIVNSSGGAPTIQNNIQNIVVQAAPNQMPHQIQIGNQAFPSQFIDNLNQQQIRNLSSGNKTTVSNTANAPVMHLSQCNQINQSNQSNVNPITTSITTMPTTPTSKKSKVVKRTKVTVSLPQTGYSQCIKTARTSVSTSTPSLSSVVKEPQNPPTIPKTEPGQLGITGRVTTSNIQTVGIQTQGNQSTQVPSNGQMVQRTPRYIQLPVQKQQMLKSIQAQIQSISSRKTNSPADQALLAKLYQEHNKIVASGKVVSAPSLTIPTASETTTSAGISSPTVYTASHPLNSSSLLKNQTSTAQTQTMTPAIVTTSCSVVTSTISTNASMPSVSEPSVNKIEGIKGGMDPSMSAIHTCQASQNKQMELPKFHSPQHNQLQQSTQCQTDPPDIKPIIQGMISPIKQELPSPVTQIQSASPAGQAISLSPRICGKGSRIQSPVNVGIKPALASPSTSSVPGAQSPRQGTKRPATSPISKQINRGDLMEQQLKIDQNGAVNPDVNTPFGGKRDACKRLVRYHCFNEQVLSAKDLAKADEIFEETAKHLLSKFNSMMNKYTYLLLMESMREVRTSELMMIDRAFVAEEQGMLDRLREQEAKATEELKKEEKPVVPKVEADLTDEEKTSTSLANVLVKQELDDDFCGMDSQSTDPQGRLKPSSCTSGDYDEWLEIQKELGVYPGDTGKCKHQVCSGASGSSANGACLSTKSLTKCERTRANGDCRLSASVNQSTIKNLYDTSDSGPMELDKRWCSAALRDDLERDLIEDTDSLDDLALQSQLPGTSIQDNESGQGIINDHDDITAQVQSAIDSILNLKKRPSNASAASTQVSSTSAGTTQTSGNSSDSKDSVLDQAVRSILGS